MSTRSILPGRKRPYVEDGKQFILKIITPRVVSRFLIRTFHPKSRWLFPFYFSNITLRTDLLTFGVTGTVFKIAGEMCQLPAYFDNPEHLGLDCTRHSLPGMRAWIKICKKQCCILRSSSAMLSCLANILWPC